MFVLILAVKHLSVLLAHTLCSNIPMGTTDIMINIHSADKRVDKVIWVSSSSVSQCTLLCHSVKKLFVSRGSRLTSVCKYYMNEVVALLLYCHSLTLDLLLHSRTKLKTAKHTHIFPSLLNHKSAHTDAYWSSTSTVYFLITSLILNTQSSPSSQVDSLRKDKVVWLVLREHNSSYPN